MRFGTAQAMKKLVDLGAHVSVVKAVKTDARRLKLLNNEAERMEEHLQFEMGSGQNANETKYTTGIASVQGAEKLTVLSRERKSSKANPLVHIYNKGNRGRTGS